jgi:hypothetical protein
MIKIWVNEQLDPSGLLYACIACCNEQQAIDCCDQQQKMAGWLVRRSVVTSWRDVPAGALELS